MPKFFRQPAFGLDISDYSIELLELGSRFKIKSCSRTTLKPGIVKNGLILEKKELIKILKKLLAQSKITTKKVVLSLPESKVFTNTFAFPKEIKEKELKRAVQLEAQKNIPLNPEKIYWDFQIVSAPSKSKEQIVFYVAVFKDIVDQYLDVLEKLDLRPDVFEIESLAIGRVLLKDLRFENNAVIIDVGARTTNINIFNKDKILNWNSSLPIAGNYFTEKISEELGISLKEAEEIKKKEGLKKDSKIANILQKEIKKIVEEIQKILNYYQEFVDKIILTGGSAQIPEIDKYLSSELNKEIIIGETDLCKKIKKHGILYHTVIGLALKGYFGGQKSEINLLPQRLKRKTIFIGKGVKESLFFKIFGYVFPLLALAFLGWVILNYTPSRSDIRQNQSILEQQTETETETDIKTEEEPEQEIKEEEGEEEEKLEQEIKKEGEGEIEEEEEEIVIEETTEKQRIQVIAGIQSLNVRKGPGTDYEIIRKIYPGEIYFLLQEQEDWYKIELELEEDGGWVASEYVEKVNN